MEYFGNFHIKISLTLNGLKIEWNDLDDVIKEHIADSLKDDCFTGEICICEEDLTDYCRKIVKED